MINYKNYYCQGDKHTNHNEIDKIEWQSLNSYHISCVEDEEITNDCNDIEKQKLSNLECTTDNKQPNEQEPEDMGCTDQWLHGQFQQVLYINISIHFCIMLFKAVFSYLKSRIIDLIFLVIK